MEAHEHRASKMENIRGRWNQRHALGLCEGDVVQIEPSVLPDELAASVSEFAELSFDDQKMIVAELVDKNRLYVNASEVEDADLGLSEADVAFTKSFYHKGG